MSCEKSLGRAAGRARIIAATKKRWAAFHEAKKAPGRKKALAWSDDR